MYMYKCVYTRNSRRTFIFIIFLRCFFHTDSVLNANAFQMQTIRPWLWIAKKNFLEVYSLVGACTCTCTRINTSSIISYNFNFCLLFEQRYCTCTFVTYENYCLSFNCCLFVYFCIICFYCIITQSGQFHLQSLWWRVPGESATAPQWGMTLCPHRLAMATSWIAAAGGLFSLLVTFFF